MEEKIKQPWSLNPLSRVFKHKPQWLGLYNCLLLSIGTCIFFSSFSASQSLLTTLRGNSGFYSLCALYGAFAITDFIAPFVEPFVGSRLLLVLGGFPYAVFVFSSGIPLDWLVIISGGILGVGAAFFWIGQASFLAKNAYLTEPNRMGLYSGIFFSIFGLNAVIGNLLTGLFKSINIPNFVIFMILGTISTLAVSSLIFTIPIPKFVVQEPFSFKSKFLTMKSILFDPKMMIFHFISIYSGYSMAFFNGSIPPLIGEKMIPWVMSVHSFSGTVVATLIGKFADSLSKRIMFILVLGLHGLGIILSFTLVLGKPYTFFLGMIIMGAADAGLNVMQYAVLGTYFAESSAECFAIFKCVQSLASAISFLTGAPLTNYFYVVQIVMIILFSLCTLSFTALELCWPVDDWIPPVASAPVHDAINSDNSDTAF